MIDKKEKFPREKIFQMFYERMEKEKKEQKKKFDAYVKKQFEIEEIQEASQEVSVNPNEK